MLLCHLWNLQLLWHVQKVRLLYCGGIFHIIKLFKMKNIIILLVLLSFIACEDNKPKETTTTATPTVAVPQAEVKTDTTHVHIFACPMHPEVTGKEGDKCPKCSMALEHKD